MPLMIVALLPPGLIIKCDDCGRNPAVATLMAGVFTDDPKTIALCEQCMDVLMDLITGKVN